MKKILLVVLIFVSAAAMAQETPNEPPPVRVEPPPTEEPSYRPEDPKREQRIPLKDRLFFGGDLGLQFGDVTYINVAPTIGYRVTEKLAFGFGPSYSYFEDKRYSGYEVSANSYGGRVFGQYRVIENAMAYAEYGVINTLVREDLYYQLIRVNIPSLLVGGGYVQPIGDVSSFNIMVLFDVIQDRYSYEQNPIIRAGVNIGF